MWWCSGDKLACDRRYTDGWWCGSAAAVVPMLGLLPCLLTAAACERASCIFSDAHNIIFSAYYVVEQEDGMLVFGVSLFAHSLICCPSLYGRLKPG